MATWDITAPAGSGVGSTNSASSSLTPPGDFDGTTINSVVIVGTPTITTAGTSNDSINIRWNIQTNGSVDEYGSSTVDADSVCYSGFVPFSTGSSANIVNGTPSPAPTTATAANWGRLRWTWAYTINGKNDAETIDWSAFTIRVTYTPAGSTSELNFERGSRRGVMRGIRGIG